ncbi:hypothetical protein C8F04DRAFT_897416, partial [Mycena alexandri]
LDFFDGAVGKPFNPPAGWMLYTLVGPSKQERMASNEEVYGFSRHAIVPGAERFRVWHHPRCRLIRPGHVDFDFRVPAR